MTESMLKLFRWLAAGYELPLPVCSFRLNRRSAGGRQRAQSQSAQSQSAQSLPGL
jgi:hypothetical protein